MYSMKKGGSAKSSKQQAAIAMSMKAASKTPKKALGGTNEGKPVIKGIGSAAASMGRKDPDKMFYEKMLNEKRESNYNKMVEKASKSASQSAENISNSIRNKQKMNDLNELYKNKKHGGPVGTFKKPKMKAGGSFPDLTGDGKVTRADVLKGRGVFKTGGSVGKSKKK